jgi:hypothetical protein
MIEIIFIYDLILYEFVPWKLNGPVSIWNISPLRINLQTALVKFTLKCSLPMHPLFDGHLAARGQCALQIRTS